MVVVIVVALPASSRVLFAAEGVDGVPAAAAAGELPVMGVISAPSYRREVRLCAHGNASGPDPSWLDVSGGAAKFVASVF